MSGVESSGRRDGGEDPDVKALWAAVNGMDQGFIDFAQEMRQTLAQIVVSPVVNPPAQPDRERDVAREQPAVEPVHPRRLERRRERRSSSDDSDRTALPVRPRRAPTPDSDTDEDVEDLLLGERRLGRGARHPPRRDTRDFKIKINLPHFHGHLHIEDFLDWIRTVENFFDYSEIAEEQRVKVVAYKLKGGAFAWWEQLQYKRKREGKRPIRSWSKMRRLLKARFLPADYEQMLYQQFQQCRQRAQSVTDYTEEFYRLSARVDLAESEPQQVARYIGGLKEAI